MRSIDPTKIWKPVAGSYSYDLSNNDSHLFIDTTGMDYYEHTVYLPPKPIVKQKHTISFNFSFTYPLYGIKVGMRSNRIAATGFTNDNELWLIRGGSGIGTPLCIVYNEIKGAVLTGTCTVNNASNQSTILVTPTNPWTAPVSSYNIKPGDLLQITSGTYAGKRRRVRSCAFDSVITDSFAPSGNESANCEINFSMGLWYPVTYQRYYT